VQEIFRSQAGDLLALNEVEIINAPGGAPYATCGFDYNQIPVSLSISHSGNRAFCAAVGLCSPAGIIGADIEQVETRPPGFVEEYFTDTEIALVSHTPVRSRDLLVTATWSAKEAALKALRLGLSVDTRTATCWIEAATDAPEDWTSFRIDWDVRRLNRFTLPGSELPDLVGWWRIMDGYVLTLAAIDHTPPQELILPSGEGA
jgi:4'-phosphopantetheinyl transferase